MFVYHSRFLINCICSLAKCSRSLMMSFFNLYAILRVVRNALLFIDELLQESSSVHSLSIKDFPPSFSSLTLQVTWKESLQATAANQSTRRLLAPECSDAAAIAAASKRDTCVSGSRSGSGCCCNAASDDASAARGGHLRSQRRPILCHVGHCLSAAAAASHAAVLAGSSPKLCSYLLFV